MLVTTLTKRMSEDLTDYLQQVGVRVRYMHSDIDAIERMEIVRGLRLGEFDVLVGINLLREGLDLPEVSLVAILDADQEGFLRSRPLADPDGRPRGAPPERHARSSTPTGSPARCSAASRRRRVAARSRRAYNEEHGITPTSVSKSIDQVRFITRVADARGEREEEQRGPRRRKVAEAEAPSYEMVEPETLVDDARAADARGRDGARLRGGGAAARPAVRGEGADGGEHRAAGGRRRLRVGATAVSDHARGGSRRRTRRSFRRWRTTARSR